MGRGEQIWQNL